MKNKHFVISAIMFLFGLIIFSSCGSKKDKVEKGVEGGAEIIHEI